MIAGNAKQFSKRIILLYLIIVSFFGIIIRQLWYLQVEQWEYYKELASKNRFRSVEIPAPRGILFDRYGRILVDNRPRFDLIATIEDVMESGSPDREAELIAKILDRPEEEIYKKITDRISHLPYEPSVILTDLTTEDVIKISEKQYLLPGIDLRILPVRHYVNEKSACHLLGYTGKISEGELERLKDQGYTIRDEVGKTGAEATFEGYLRGVPGERQIQVNSFGHLDKIFGEKKPVKGFDVYLTLDLKIQKIIENAYQGRNGAAVVMEVDTGNVIAMISQPGFDPNMFATGNSEKIQNYFYAQSFPLLNRVISSEFAPGSIFKPLVALTALEKGYIKEGSSVFCNGIFKLGEMSFKCWKKWGHGETNVTRALEQSCNVFFYNMGKEMGYKPIYELGKEFGFGERTGIALTGEKTGILPCEDWKKKYFKNKDQQKWHLGDSINYAIGQGYVLVTPIQMARFAATLATGGIMPTPNILYKVVNNQGATVATYQPPPPRKIVVDQSNLDKVKIGMFNVIHAKYGTGRKAKVEGLHAAGKTGTAQVKSRKGDTQNAWFICFAPFENPKISMAVMVEGGESGGEAAVPIAKQILSAYFNVAIPTDNKVKGSEEQVSETENVNDVTSTQGESIDSDQLSEPSNYVESATKPRFPFWSRIKNFLKKGEEE